MFKACSKCGKIHDVNYDCHHGDHSSAEKKMRSKYVWTKKSREVRDQANYLCEVCRDQGIFNYENVEVHHLQPLRDRKDLYLENNNLICLCSKHHKEAENGDIDIEYLKKLIDKRENPPPKNL